VKIRRSGKYQRPEINTEGRYRTTRISRDSQSTGYPHRLRGGGLELVEPGNKKTGQAELGSRGL